jgi:hypothetical protein
MKYFLRQDGSDEESRGYGGLNLAVVSPTKGQDNQTGDTGNRHLERNRGLIVAARVETEPATDVRLGSKRGKGGGFLREKNQSAAGTTGSETRHCRRRAVST